MPAHDIFHIGSEITNLPEKPGDPFEHIFRGSYPPVYDRGVKPGNWYAQYTQSYLERDVRQLINVSDQHAFETFIKLLAGRVGQVVNLSGLSGDVGVSSTTLNSWLSVLEASYIVFRLPCFFKNFGKRLTKAPKIYFTEVGLAASLLGIETVSQVARDPLLGGLFENLVVAEALKARYNLGKQQPDLYYFRVQGRHEVDLIIDRADGVVNLCEMKFAREPYALDAE